MYSLESGTGSLIDFIGLPNETEKVNESIDTIIMLINQLQ